MRSKWLESMALSVLYVMLFLLIVLALRTGSNIAYGYVAAWCMSLWTASLFHLKPRLAIPSFILFLAVYMLDGFGRYYLFTLPKQSEDFTFVLFAAVCTLPILINFSTQKILANIIERMGR